MYLQTREAVMKYPLCCILLLLFRTVSLKKRIHQERLGDRVRKQLLNSFIMRYIYRDLLAHLRYNSNAPLLSATAELKSSTMRRN